MVDLVLTDIAMWSIDYPLIVAFRLTIGAEKVGLFHHFFVTKAKHAALKLFWRDHGPSSVKMLLRTPYGMNQVSKRTLSTWAPVVFRRKCPRKFQSPVCYYDNVLIADFRL